MNDIFNNKKNNISKNNHLNNSFNKNDTYESVCSPEDIAERNKQLAQRNGIIHTNNTSLNNTRLLKRVVSAPAASDKGWYEVKINLNGSLWQRFSVAGPPPPPLPPPLKAPNPNYHHANQLNNRVSQQNRHSPIEVADAPDSDSGFEVLEEPTLRPSELVKGNHNRTMSSISGESFIFHSVHFNRNKIIKKKVSLMEPNEILEAIGNSWLFPRNSLLELLFICFVQWPNESHRIWHRIVPWLFISSSLVLCGFIFRIRFLLVAGLELIVWQYFSFFFRNCSQHHVTLSFLFQFLICNVWTDQPP